jgi:hypothetical protein
MLAYVVGFPSGLPFIRILAGGYWLFWQIDLVGRGQTQCLQDSAQRMIGQKEIRIEVGNDVFLPNLKLFNVFSFNVYMT